MDHITLQGVVTAVLSLVSINLLAAAARDAEGWDRNFGVHAASVKGFTVFLGTLAGGGGLAQAFQSLHLQ